MIKKVFMLVFCLTLGYGISVAMVILWAVQDALTFWVVGLETGLFFYWLQAIWDVEENTHVTVPGVDK